MKTAKIGLVGLCSPIESGGERHDELIASATAALGRAGLEVVTAFRSVWNAGDALHVCDQMKEADIDAIAIMDVTWVMDSLKYIFVHELKVPVVFWAVPYPETFSIGCVQNFASVLKTQGIKFEYVYGLAEDEVLISKIKKVAIAGTTIRRLKTMRLALAGTRQTWRVAGPQDMSLEEWDFSEKLGPTIIHLEMEDIIGEAEKISEADAARTLEELKTRTGQIKCSEKVMLQSAKMYMATKSLIEEYKLDGVAAECYPCYGGLMNQVASWLADEGFIVDTEGDIAHTVLQFILNLLSENTPCVLGETSEVNNEQNYLAVCHEGSSPSSMAASLDKVVVNPSGETGSFVGVPVKQMDKVTFADFQGADGKYQLFAATGSTLPVSHEEWIEAGEKMVTKLRSDSMSPACVIDKMISEGFHHHIVVKEGDLMEQLKVICEFADIKLVSI